MMMMSTSCEVFGRRRGPRSESGQSVGEERESERVRCMTRRGKHQRQRETKGRAAWGMTCNGGSEGDGKVRTSMDPRA